MRTPLKPPPGPICATLDGTEHVNTFLKEALATVLQVQILLQATKRSIYNYYSPQGNEDLREMFVQHEALAMEAVTRIDEIEAERNSYFTNAVELTTHFRETPPGDQPRITRGAKREVSQEVGRASHHTHHHQTIKSSKRRARYPRDIT